jgi:predicted DNA-binding transcriptional regulator AlpA
MEPQRVTSSGVEIAGTRYLPATQLAKNIGVSRTTLWRWRHEGKIPLGRRYRNGLILFSPAEVELVRKYSDRLEPVSGKGSEQPKRHDGALPRRQ